MPRAALGRQLASPGRGGSRRVSGGRPTGSNGVSVYASNSMTMRPRRGRTRDFCPSRRRSAHDVRGRCRRVGCLLPRDKESGHAAALGLKGKALLSPSRFLPRPRSAGIVVHGSSASTNCCDRNLARVRFPPPPLFSYSNPDGQGAAWVFAESWARPARVRDAPEFVGGVTRS
jgi:hypothetical protein